MAPLFRFDDDDDDDDDDGDGDNDHDHDNEIGRTAEYFDFDTCRLSVGSLERGCSITFQTKLQNYYFIPNYQSREILWTMLEWRHSVNFISSCPLRLSALRSPLSARPGPALSVRDTLLFLPSCFHA